MSVKKLLLTIVSFGGCALASPIGYLGIGSSGVVDATLTSILFTPDVSATCPASFNGGVCNGEVNSGTTLTFAGGPLSVTEGILINGGFPVGTPPPANAQFFNPFLQFAAHPNLTYTLQGVSPGSSNTNCAGLASGQSCSILENGTPSPVVLTANGAGGAIVNISLFGTASDGVGLSSNWTGLFSATIPNMTPLQIEQYFCGADAVCSASEIANSPTLEVRSTSGSFFATAVPEPSTTVMLGAGLVLLSLTLRRVKAHVR